MVNVETLYKENIRLLPFKDQLHLVELIMKRTGRELAERRSAMNILESLEPKNNQRTAVEIDEYLRSERDSWDN